MQHTESDVKVYVTTDYSIFSRTKGNRDIDKFKIKKIVREIKNGNNLLADFPILTVQGIVNLDVKDGQHRLAAAEQTGKPIYYIIRKTDLSLDKMAGFNSLQSKWKPKDFINCYVEKGSKDYKILDEFTDRYRLPISISLNLLYYGVTGSDMGAREDISLLFKKGHFVVKHMKQATEIIEQCKRFEAFGGWNTRPFMVTISKILGADKCDFDELVEKFNQDPRALVRHSNTKAYLTNLETIYNKGYSKRRIIF
jgi:hypothetical protein